VRTRHERDRISGHIVDWSERAVLR
jgi:hypothetical protein